MSTVDDVTAPLCLATGCSRSQTTGARLCAIDTRRLGDWIAGLGTEYDQLSAVPSMQAPTGGTTSGGALKSHRSVGDLDVMLLRDARSRERLHDDPDGNRGRGVLEVLGYWAAAVRQERKLQPPTRQIVIRLRDERAAGPLCPVMASAFTGPAVPCQHDTCRAAVVLHTAPAPRTVASERKLLSDHLRWIVAQDAAGQFFDEIRAVWDLLRAANSPGTPVVRPDCPACGELARWVTGSVVCAACMTTTAGLAVLRRRQDGTAA